jgi:predicted dehydrogenase
MSIAAPLRVGLIGAGMVSQHHLLAWAKLRGIAEVVAIADPSPAHAAKRAGDFAIARTYATAAAMLAEERLDAIDIAAPREHHAGLVRLGVSAGLAVLCQKPLAPTLAEAEALVAETAGARLMVHENWRFRRYYRDAARWLTAGTIGDVQQCQITLLTSGLLPDANGDRPALQRQPFMRHERRMLVNEVLIHHLDTMRVLLGELEVTAARLGRACPDMAGEDNAVITLRAASGAGAILLGNMAAPGFPATQADEMLVLGTTGAIRLHGNRLERLGAAPETIDYDLAECYQGSYDATIAHFVTALREGTPFETTPADNLRTLRLVEDAYRLSNWRADISSV